MSSASKQFEKRYLRRTAAGDWERLKPFSPPGADTVDDSAHLMLDFAMALRHLAPSASDLVLDLGAGACWCSEWLQRLNIRTVAVDISLDMLTLGRTRLPQPTRAALVAGDLERLPFAAATFDKAICLNALHHVPDMTRAVHEIGRVLTDEGAAIFSEPGKGHAGQPGSVSAMRDFGVLEQDVLVEELMDACARAGFVDVQIKPVSYVVPEFGLSRADWVAWRQLARRKRPWRAAEKMWRAAIELFGFGKHGALFEETFAISLVRLLRGAMEDHPIVLASKRPRSRREDAPLRADIHILDAPSSVRSGERVSLTIRIRNDGIEPWPVDDPAGMGRVRIGIQLLDADGRLLNRDLERHPLPQVMTTAASITATIWCAAPPVPGDYHLKVDLVKEGVSWFEPLGSQAAVRRLKVI